MVILDPHRKFLERDETGQWKPLPKERALIKISQALRTKEIQERKPKVIMTEIIKETCYTCMEHLNYTPNFITVLLLYLPMHCNVQKILSATSVSEAQHKIPVALALSSIERHNTTSFQRKFS